MSHTTKIRAMQISNVGVIRAAVARLAQQGVKIELLEDAQPRHYYTKYGREQEGMGKADLVLKIADSSYDVGLYKQPDGSYEPRTDFWDKEVEKVLGVKPTAEEYTDQAKLGKFYQAYGICAAMEQAYLSGKQVQEITQPNGDVQLVVTGYA